MIKNSDLYKSAFDIAVEEELALAYKLWPKESGEPTVNNLHVKLELETTLSENEGDDSIVALKQLLTILDPSRFKVIAVKSHQSVVFSVREKERPTYDGDE